jgi:hypothetical protein
MFGAIEPGPRDPLGRYAAVGGAVLMGLVLLVIVTSWGQGAWSWLIDLLGR